jgi:hypothetical protein
LGKFCSMKVYFCCFHITTKKKKKKRAQNFCSDKASVTVFGEIKTSEICMNTVISTDGRWCYIFKQSFELFLLQIFRRMEDGVT